MNGREHEEKASFWEHARCLRNLVLGSLLIVSLGAGCALFFHREILAWITAPLKENLWQECIVQEVQKKRITNLHRNAKIYTLPNHTSLVASSEGVQQIGKEIYQIPPHGFVEFEQRTSAETRLLLLHPLDGLLLALRISLWTGILATAPLWVPLLLQFFLPALHPNEQKFLAPFFFCTTASLIAGGLFAYYIVLPLSNSYLIALNESMGTNWWTLKDYVDYTLTLFLGTIFASALSFLLLCLVHFQYISVKALIEKRRHVSVAAFVIAALITPPDVLSQVVIAVFLLAVYELAIFYGKYCHKKRLVVKQGF